jgi:hypothetical protein
VIVLCHIVVNHVSNYVKHHSPEDLRLVSAYLFENDLTTLLSSSANHIVMMEYDVIMHACIYVTTYSATYA